MERAQVRDKQDTCHRSCRGGLHLGLNRSHVHKRDLRYGACAGDPKLQGRCVYHDAVRKTAQYMQPFPWKAAVHTCSSVVLLPYSLFIVRCIGIFGMDCIFICAPQARAVLESAPSPTHICKWARLPERV